LSRWVNLVGYIYIVFPQEVLILDEADCLLSMGFERALNAILQMLPKQRRTGLFSATQTTEVRKLIRAGLRNPVSVVVTDKAQKGKTPASLDNCYAIVEPQLKLFGLVNFIRNEKDKKILIFFSTCACVDYFSYVLGRFVFRMKMKCEFVSDIEDSGLIVDFCLTLV
jgi:ATP-dependent RNA helicase DDX55/SPB4